MSRDVRKAQTIVSYHTNVVYTRVYKEERLASESIVQVTFFFCRIFAMLLGNVRKVDLGKCQLRCSRYSGRHARRPSNSRYLGGGLRDDQKMT